MKTKHIISVCIIALSGFTLNAQGIADPTLLEGNWKLDMSPQDTTDSNFATMEITQASTDSFKGTFYRKGVKIREGKINTQKGMIYGALISGDNSGVYHSTFYLKDGKLQGTTHAIDRGFLAVWTATKTK